MRQGLLWFIRIGVLGAALLFSIITMSLSAVYIAKLHNFDGLYSLSVPAFAGLALAISLITLFTVGPMIVFDILRRGAITSWIMVELAVTGVLMVLWLATAADTAAATNGSSIDCSAADSFSSDAGMICHTYQAIEAFSFIIWIFFLCYFGTLLAFALIAHSHGNNVWRGTVRDTDFSARSTGTDVPMTQQDKTVV